MLKAAIIADDFTGANATGVLLKKKGYKVATCLNPDTPPVDAEFDVLSISTNSRSIEPDKAYEIVYKTTKRLEGVSPYLSKRIDSTLRGNLGSEIDAILDAIGKDYRAVVVPVYPKSNRTCIGGYLLVNGTPLELTEVARDPKSPIASSSVGELIALQSKRSIGYIPISAVLKGPETIGRYINMIEDDIILIDAISDDDIDNIAIAFKNYDNIVCVDPGPFTASYIGTKYEGETGGNTFLIIGSTSDLTYSQVRYLSEKRNVFLHRIDVKELLKAPESIINQAIQVLESNYRKDLIMGVTTKSTNEDIIDLKSYSRILNVDVEEVSQNINNSLSKIAYSFIKDKPFDNLYVTGGDTALSLFNTFGVNVFSIKDEVLPLAVHGIVNINGNKQLNVVTKGGLVGGIDALYNIVVYLESLKKGEPICQKVL
ncbi:MAG: four-carbon acid sugar kinase family protein [Thermoanaerobacteraceae bacterium]|nr:four-carbon acid sugar kinase family protein [Thermoanaerobacteraceae bacterium]